MTRISRRSAGSTRTQTAEPIGWGASRRTSSALRRAWQRLGVDGQPVGCRSLPGSERRQGPQDRFRGCSGRFCRATPRPARSAQRRLQDHGTVMPLGVPGRRGPGGRVQGPGLPGAAVVRPQPAIDTWPSILLRHEVASPYRSCSQCELHSIAVSKRTTRATGEPTVLNKERAGQCTEAPQGAGRKSREDLSPGNHEPGDG